MASSHALYFWALSAGGKSAGSDTEGLAQLKAELAAVKAELAAEEKAHQATKAALAAAQGKGTDASAADKPAKADDDFDLFADDEDDSAHEAEIERRAQEQLAKTAAKHANQGVVMKSAIVIDVKPWEDTTDLVELERLIREISIDGLEWKAAKLIPIGYGIKKLSISCHVEDAKVSVDDIQEKIQEFEDFVQSTDVVTFTKL